ncbi:serine hydrolase domain-containing protein [Vibrio pacinii]|uniref:serine hydrolase domain-containing protein n=1 Tax=Vibrio pacinii TaxID=170674 RepID=UPI00056F565C|nr:serine hydrolase domain-containing protein [Vibrio pacinii]
MNHVSKLSAILLVAMSLNTHTYAAMNTATDAKSSTKYAGQQSNLTLADHKKLLEEGYPIDRVRRAHDLFSFRHFSVDALDYKKTAVDDALYYFNHMWEFLPSAVVPKASNSFELVRDLDSDLNNLTYSDIDGKPFPTLQEFIDAPDSMLQGIMMIHKGKVIFEQYPGMRPQDQHLWMSVTKALSGTLILDMIVNGKIDPEAPITDYVPRLKDSAWDGVPVRAVLTMTAGLNLDDISGNMYKSGTIEQRYYKASFGDYYNGKKEDWIEVIREGEKIAEPYTKFQYASLNTQVLSVAIENVTGKKFVDYLYERLFQHAGTGEMVANLFPDGSIHAATAMNSTLEDMGRFGLLYTPSFEKLSGKQVISPKIVDYMFDIKVPAKILNENIIGQTAHLYLGNQSVVGSGSQFDFLWSDGAFAKLGHNNQGIYIDPKRDFVGVYFSASTKTNYPIGYIRAAAVSMDK